MIPVRHLWRVSPLQDPSISCFPPAVQPKFVVETRRLLPKAAERDVHLTCESGSRLRVQLTVRGVQ